MARSFASASSQYLGGINPGFPAGDYTLSIWCYTTDVTTNRAMWSYRSTTTGNVGFQVDVNASNARFLWGAAGSVSADSKAITANAWHNVVCTRSGNNGLIYVDASAGSGFTDTDRAAVNSLNIAAIVNSSSTRSLFWNGQLAEAAIWDGVALDTAEITALTRGYAPPMIRPASLTYYWPMVGRHSPEIDVMGGNTMTLNASPTTADGPRLIYPAPAFSFDVTAAAATGQPAVKRMGGVRFAHSLGRGVW